MKTTRRTTNPINPDENGTYNALKQAVCKAYAARLANWTAKTDAALGDAVQQLAAAVAYSVLKKCRDPQRGTPSARPTPAAWRAVLDDLRRDIAAGIAHLDSVARYNADPDADNADPDAVIDTVLGDGYDLLQAAALAILEALETAPVDAQNAVPDLDAEITVRRPRRCVVIKDSPAAWETVKDRPMKEVYRAVRRTISNGKAVTVDPRSPYTYIADLASDPDSDTDAVIYRRYGRYADVGGQEVDYNGRPTVYTGDAETAMEMTEIMDRLHLSAMEARVLEYRFARYGHKAIATALERTENTIKTYCERIQNKALAAGLNLFSNTPKQ